MEEKILQKVLNRYNKHTVEYLALNDFKNLTNYVLFDAREDEEFEISHLPKAIHIGYNYFKLATAQQHLKSKQQLIVIYCSISVRSERIGEQLKEAGYSNVYNLHGGIFAWKNKGNIIVDETGSPTERVHTYNKKWSKYLTNGVAVY